MPRRGRDRLLCNDFQCMRQFASGILSGRLGPHNPPALDREPLSQPVEGTVHPLPAAVQDMPVDPRRLDVLVPQEEAANPVDVGLLGPAAVMGGPQGLHRAVVQPRSRLAREQPQRWSTNCRRVAQSV